MTRYRSIPVEVEAIQWDGTTVGAMEIQDWSRGSVRFLFDELRLWVTTLEGGVKAQEGDWIICGTKGEFYPCKPEVFAERYEAVVA